MSFRATRFLTTKYFKQGTVFNIFYFKAEKKSIGKSRYKLRIPCLVAELQVQSRSLLQLSVVQRQRVAPSWKTNSKLKIEGKSINYIPRRCHHQYILHQYLHCRCNFYTQLQFLHFLQKYLEIVSTVCTFFRSYLLRDSNWHASWFSLQ